MRLLLVAVLALAGVQDRQDGTVWRGPLLMGPFPVEAVQPAAGMPLAITNARLDPGGLAGPFQLRATVRRTGIRSFAASGIALRLALGPVNDGLVTVRMVPKRADDGTPLERTLGSGRITLVFAPDPADPSPVPRTIARGTRLAVTVDNIRDENGGDVWMNPDAVELLRRALGLATTPGR